MGAVYFQWGWYTDGNVCNITKKQSFIHETYLGAKYEGPRSNSFTLFRL